MRIFTSPRAVGCGAIISVLPAFGTGSHVSPFARIPSDLRKRTYDNPGILKFVFARFSGHFDGFAVCLCAVARGPAHNLGVGGTHGAPHRRRAGRKAREDVHQAGADDARGCAIAADVRAPDARGLPSAASTCRTSSDPSASDGLRDRAPAASRGREPAGAVSENFRKLPVSPKNRVILSSLRSWKCERRDAEKQRSEEQ
jgi:hypothetical protein